MRTAQGSADLSEAVKAIATQLAATDMPGLCIGVTDRKELLRVTVHGHADLKAKMPLTADARMAIGSVSKSFTAIALLQLAAEGRIDLQAPINRYLPDFRLRSEFAPITAHHLLLHTSGLPGYLVQAASSRYVLAALREFDPAYAPGKQWAYSNSGYQLLGYVLEDIESESYPAIIRRRILGPLDMSATTSVIDDAQRAGMAISYTRWPYDDAYREAPWFEYSAADGSLVSTITDMCAYARCLLNRGAGPGGSLLNESSFATMTTPVIGDYGYGLFIRLENGTTVVGHEGGIAGFHSVLKAHLEQEFAVVILSSSYIENDLKQWIGECIAAAFDGSLIPKAPIRCVASNADAREYVGLYSLGDYPGNRLALEFVEANGGLALKEGHEIRRLERFAVDCFRFRGDSPGLPFFFGRAGEHLGARVVEVSRGERWYVSSEFSGKQNAPLPLNYSAYVGHFAHDGPEGPVARVFVRNARLWLMLSYGDRPVSSRLQPLSEGTFGVVRASAENEHADRNPICESPERVTFDSLMDGRALRMSFSGVPLYRKDTP